MNRIIFHCDLDCFFAAVEIRDNKKIRNKPVIIGADPKGGEGRGVVSTCSYEARKYGIHSAMPISKAFKLCPHGIYLKPNHKKYHEVSLKVMEILKSYSPIIQKVSIDEAYLDMSDFCSDFIDAKRIAMQMKDHIQNSLGITCSIGISGTKSIAKIASDHNKPNGICVVPSDKIKDFLRYMPITRIPGIGKKTKLYYYKHGIRKIGDIIDLSLVELMDLIGKSGKWIWKVVNGKDTRKVKEFGHKRKSISKERTFYEDTDNFEQIFSKLEDLNTKIHKKLIKEKISYKTITLKIRLEGFETYTRSKSVDFPICNKELTTKILLELMEEFIDKQKKVRLIGLKFSNFERTNKIRQTTITTFCNLYN